MGEQVLSDAQLRKIIGQGLRAPEWDVDPSEVKDARAIERATIAALAARSGVDVEALAGNLYNATPPLGSSVGSGDWWNWAYDVIADAIRLALATAEARHAEREAMWRELRELECGYLVSNLSLHPSLRIDELRRALGLEGA